MALPNPEFPDAVYLVFPREGFGPTYEGTVEPKPDLAGVWMEGGGYEYRFGWGSGGPGTVFGPIPIPQGKPLW